MSPFCFGLFIAYLIEKPVALLGRWFGLPRKPAVIVVLLLTLFLLGLGLTLFFAGLYRETKELLLVLPTQIQRLGQGLERLKTEVSSRLEWPQDFWNYDRLWMENFRNAVSSLLYRALNLFRGFPVFLFNLLLSGFTAYFLSRDRRKIRQLFLSFFPPHWQQTIRVLHHQTLVSGWRFLKTQLLLAAITGLLSTAGLAILGFTKPWLAGCLLGLVDFLPDWSALVYLPWADGSWREGRCGTLVFGVPLFTAGVRQILGFVWWGNFRVPSLIGAGLTVHWVKTLGIGGFLFGYLLCAIRSLYQGLFTDHRKTVMA